ncbi:fibronectin type III domain-containing protein [Micromonospora parva]|uniref:fibronectin type III domain-containing protein n=1 Tax=Micromonospora parva TaxID=1464048 RepID=UPI003720B05D
MILPANRATAGIPVGGIAAGDLNTLFNNYGNAGGHWTGGDGTASVALPDGRVVWLFADTFLGSVNPDFSRPAFSPMVNNAMVVQDGMQLGQTLFGGTSANPRALVAPDADTSEFYWPADGMVEGGLLKVLYSRLRTTGADTLDFEYTGHALATFNLPSLTLASLTDLPLPSAINWGSALLSDGGYTYIYGTSTAPGRLKFAHIARAATGLLGSPWQFWTGSGWSSNAAEAGRVMSGVGTAYSVQKVGSQYVLATNETSLGFDSQIAAYTAPSPTGPFTGPRYVYTAPELQTGTNTVVYDVRAHPELARTGKLLFSYNVNSLDRADQMADARLYRPRFIEIDWPLPSSPDTPAAPTGLTVTAEDNRARLSWSPVAGPTSYRVHLRDVTAGQSHFARLRLPNETTLQTVELLIPGHTYEFKVTAVNGAGEGAFSAAVAVTPHSTKPVADTIGYAGSPEAIAGSYIVSLRRGAVAPENLEQFARQLIGQHDGTLGRLYPLTLHGFSAELTESQARDLAADPDVVGVEQNVLVSLDSAGVQNDPPWHLDRIDQRDTALNGLYRYPNNGAGVTAYVLDSGLWPGHPEFSGRVATGYNGIDLSTDTADCNGHGTQVTGALGGTTHGVAKGVSIVPVKVFGCNGKARNDSIISGIEWVNRNAKAPAVLNLSFGVTGNDKSRLQQSVERTLRRGLTVVTSAGNNNGSACLAAPNALPGVIVVGATARGAAPDRVDTRWTEGNGGSNFGSCVDIWAPGAGISTATLNNLTTSNSGTSLAAPQVAGAAAIVLAAHPDYSYESVEQALVGASTRGVADAKSDRDGLLFIEQPPAAAPKDLTATANVDGTVGLRWSAVDEPNVHYLVSSRDVTAGEAEFRPWPAPVFDATTAVSTRLTIGHRYEFIVRAANTAGTGPQSNVASATATIPPPPPPTSLSASANNDGSIRLNWSSPGGEVWYRVYQRDVTATESEFTQWPLPVTGGTTALAQYLTHGHEYEFKVTATNQAGESTGSNLARATASLALPQAPSGLAATAQSDGTIKLAWTAASGEVWHQIYQRDVTAGESEFTAWPYPVTEGSTTVAQYLAHGHEYEFKVTATNQAGESAGASLARATATYTLPQAPSGLSVVAGDGQATLNWSSAEPNVWHKVYQRDVTLGETLFTAWPFPVTEGTSATATALTNGHEYEFKVVGTNQAGEGPASNTVRATPLPPKPAAPTNLTAKPQSDGTVQLSWQASTSNVWHVVYQRDVTAGQTAFTKWPLPVSTGTSALAQYLSHGHVYEFKIAATNVAGEGPATSAARVTAQVAPPAAPTDLRGGVAGEGKIELNWNAPAPGVYSVIYWRDVTAGQTGFTRVEYLTTDTSITMEYLQQAHVYEYKVAATTIGGEGPASSTIQVTARYSLPAPATSLTAAAGDGKVTLGWAASPTGNVEYLVYYRDTTIGQSWQRLAYPVTARSVVMEYLTNGHTYQFRVAASNAGGQSAPTNTVSAKPMPPSPQPPSGLIATPGDGKVSLRWTSSSTANVWYWIEMRDATAGQAWTRLKDPVDGTSIPINYLNNGHGYEFRVRANNLSGDSAPSNVATAKPMPPMPQAPSGLTATAGDGKVSLRWSASATPYVWYLVEYRPSGGSWRQLSYPVTTCCTFTQNLLTNGTTYDFRVRATNLTGDSAASNVASARPMPPFPSNASGLTATAGDAKVELKWVASPTSSAQYFVELRSSGGSWQRLPYAAGCCSFTLNLLQNGRTYDFRVLATNVAGTASGSNIASAKPMPPLPKAPSNLVATGGSGEAYLTWTASPTPNVGYYAYLRNVSSGGSWHHVDLFSSATSAYMKYLIPGDLYSFRVTAWNISGESTSSNIVSVRIGHTGSDIDCNRFEFRLPFGGSVGWIELAQASWGVVPVPGVIKVYQSIYKNGQWFSTDMRRITTDSNASWSYKAPLHEVSLGYAEYVTRVLVEGPNGEQWGTDSDSCLGS